MPKAAGCPRRRRLEDPAQKWKKGEGESQCTRTTRRRAVEPVGLTQLVEAARTTEREGVGAAG